MAQQRRGGFKRRKKVDYIAANKIEYVDYKDTELLSRFVSERGKSNNSYQTRSRNGFDAFRK